MADREEILLFADLSHELAVLGRGNPTALAAINELQHGIARQIRSLVIGYQFSDMAAQPLSQEESLKLLRKKAANCGIDRILELALLRPMEMQKAKHEKPSG